MSVAADKIDQVTLLDGRLKGNDLGPKGAERIAKMLEVNKTLVSIECALRKSNPNHACHPN